MKYITSKILPFIALTALTLTSCNQQGGDLLIADFEGTGFDEWTVEGEAFGSGPSDGVINEDFTTEGFEGEGAAISLHGGVESTGKLTSGPFNIQRDYINFLAAGELIAGVTCVNLLVNGEVVATSPESIDSPQEYGEFKWFSWNVMQWKGRQAVIEVIDRMDEDWGLIAVDHFFQSDLCKAPTAFLYDITREITFDNQYLNVPVKEGDGEQLMSIIVDDEKILEFSLELAMDEPDYWMFLDLNPWQGKTAVLRIAKLPEGSGGLQAIFVDETVKGFENLYKEKDRPQYHFTSRRGWHNDPNGLVFYEGEYHLFYQHNPMGWPWGNMTWGHAVSEDLVYWEELAPAIYPDHQGTEFSGSGVIDWKNTTSFQDGEDPPLVLIYTAAGGTSRWSREEPFTQCIAYSNDRGRTFTKYEGNPVLDHIVGGNRDPKVIWYEPTGEWVMALYLEEETFALFTSPDLKSWTQIQGIKIADGDECPDFFPLALDGDENNVKWVLTAANGRFLSGTFDGKKFTPETGSQPSEFGMNYYAVQSYSDIPDGRRIQFGWMAGSAFHGMPFNQQMSVARELTLKTTPEGIRLFGVPVREIENLHGKKQEWNDLVVNPGENPLSDFHGDLYHIIAEFDMEEASATEFGFNLKGFEIRYDREEGLLTAYRPADKEKREVELLPENGKIRMEILLDRASVEFFANDGLIPMACFHLPEDKNAAISLQSKGGTIHLSSLKVYEMNSIWE